MSGYFNEGLKTAYIFREGAPESTEDIYKSVFRRSKVEEERLQRDLKDFTRDDFRNLFHYLEPSTIPAVRTLASFISNYVEWAIENGHRTSRDNPLKPLGDSFIEAVVSGHKLYINEEELLEIEADPRISFANKVILRLIWEGVLGKANSELLNLHKDDIDFDNRMLTLHDDDKDIGERTIQVSERCIEIIKAALNEDNYTITTPRGNRDFELINTGYVIKKTTFGKASADTSGKATKQVTMSRLKDIAYGLEMKFLTPTNVRRSGMISMAKNLFLRDGELSPEQFREISKQFGIKKINRSSNPNEVNMDYNYYYTVKVFTTRDNILKLYGIDIEKEPSTQQ